jgi:RND family efflux transporter MFP subunit
VLVLPGAKVSPATVVAVLNNPQLQQEALDAEWKVKAGEADYKNLQVQLENQLLSMKSEVSKVDSDYSQARLQADMDTALNKFGVISNLATRVSQARADQLGAQQDIEHQRLSNSRKVLEAQLQVKQAELEQLRALAELKRSQMTGLHVLAGINGVLQEQLVKVGQWVAAGTTLAKVVQPEHLKAELRIPETLAKDIQIGQPAEIDTHNGTIAGHVIRVDPSVQNGSVTVDVSVDEKLPQGTRPDLSIDGTINLERMDNVLYVGRPTFGKEQTVVQLYRLDPNGNTATRVPVKLGRSSANAVEVLQGLKEGDRVVLSDMSNWERHDRIHLE